MKRALILTYNKFPNGDAGAVRQYSFAKMLEALKYEVFVIGMGTVQENAEQCYKGIKYVSFRNVGKNILDRIDNFFGYEKKLKVFLNNCEPIDLLLVVDLPKGAMKLAEKYAVKHNAILLHDSVEWYSPEEFRLGIFSPEYIRNNSKNKGFFNPPWRIVGISSYLTEHFLSQGLQAARIPIVLDLDGVELNKRCEQDKTLIVYAGAPGGKDCFDQVVVAIEMLDDSVKSKLELRIIGVSEEQFKAKLRIDEARWIKLKDVICCISRVPRDEVIKHLEEADYTILFRQAHLRYAKAGFPTKVPESLSTGTPVICNLSSDLDMYLVDGDNSIIIESYSADAIKAGIERAMMISAEDRARMQYNAFITAKKCFDYREYIGELEKLLR